MILVDVPAPGRRTVRGVAAVVVDPEAVELGARRELAFHLSFYGAAMSIEPAEAAFSGRLTPVLTMDTA